MAPKLFIAIGSLGYGGAERQVIEFVRSAHSVHAECTIVCMAEAGPLAPAVRELGVRVEVLGMRRPRWHYAAARLVRLLRDERPDAVYALLFHQYTYVLPIARFALPGAVRIAGRRSMAEYDIGGFPGASRLRKVADRVSDVIIANSNPVRADWEQENARLRGRIEVVPNGIRMPDVDAVPPPGDGRHRIVCVANLIGYKGHAVLVDALGRLAGRDDWVADFVGEGPERGALGIQLQRLGIAQRVTLRGALRSLDVHALVKGSDIAVLPSFTEGLPNAVMEAMGHGVPNVASDVGGVRDLLGTGAGIVVPAHDAGALADGLAAFLDDPARRAAAGAEGKRLVQTVYSVEAMRNSTLDVINRAIAARD